MAHFPDIPKVAYWGKRDGSKIYVLTEDYYFDGGYVPKYFLTDGVSVCRLLWRWFNPLGLLFPAAVMHDYRYARQRTSRKMADREMLDDMEDLGVGRFKRLLVYRVLRAVGWKAWQENQCRSYTDFWAVNSDGVMLNEINETVTKDNDEYL